jgi:hypothetical protein
MVLEGHGPGNGFQTAGHLDGFSEERLVAPVNAVENADGQYNGFFNFHNSLLSLRGMAAE